MIVLVGEPQPCHGDGACRVQRCQHRYLPDILDSLPQCRGFHSRRIPFSEVGVFSCLFYQRRHVVGQVEVRVEQQQGVSELRVHRSVVQIGWIPPRHVQYEPLNLPCQQRVHVLHYLHVGRCAVGAYDEAHRHFGLEVGAPRRCWISEVFCHIHRQPFIHASRKHRSYVHMPVYVARRYRVGRVVC